MYNTHFWARHFGISVSSIRNIFNYLAYPELDIKTKEVIRILTFIDEDLVKNRKMIADMSREDYVKYLEEDYFR